MKKKFVLPKFKNEDEEHAFWEGIDLTDYLDASDWKPFNLDEFLKAHRPQVTRVTMRIPIEVVTRYKAVAAKLDVPYQSLMKQQLAKGAGV